MLGEIAADHVVPVADAARHLAGAVEQQPRVLQPAEQSAKTRARDREAGVAGVKDLKRASVIGAEALVEPHVDQVGVDRADDRRAGGDLVAVLLAEAGRRAVAVLDAVEALLGLVIGRSGASAAGRSRIVSASGA